MFIIESWELQSLDNNSETYETSHLSLHLFQ